MFDGADGVLLRALKFRLSKCTSSVRVCVCVCVCEREREREAVRSKIVKYD